MPKKVKGDWEDKVPAKIYCLRCKGDTKNEGKIEIVLTSNNRVMAKVPCAKCEMKKSRILGVPKE